MLVIKKDEYVHYTMEVGAEDTAAEDGQRVADVADGVAWDRLQHKKNQLTEYG